MSEMRELYPFLYSGGGDLDSVMAEVGRSTIEKAEEIVALRQTVLAADGARLEECARQMAEAFREGGRGLEPADVELVDGGEILRPEVLQAVARRLDAVQDDPLEVAAAVVARDLLLDRAHRHSSPCQPSRSARGWRVHRPAARRSARLTRLSCRSAGVGG
jgi:hypothetical protein